MRKPGLIMLALMLLFISGYSTADTVDIVKASAEIPEAVTNEKNPNTAGQPEQTAPQTYSRYQPLTENYAGNKNIYRLTGNYYIFIGPYNSGGAGRFDSSPSLYLLEKRNESFVPIYRSSHSGDSYSLIPSFYKTASGDDPIIVLAEMGTEYSWGARVFMVKGTNVIDAGILDVAIEGKHGWESVVPYTRISILAGQVQFTFTTDVFFNQGGKNEKKFSKDNIKYIYENGKLSAEIK